MVAVDLLNIIDSTGRVADTGKYLPGGYGSGEASGEMSHRPCGGPGDMVATEP